MITEMKKNSIEQLEIKVYKSSKKGEQKGK